MWDSSPFRPLAVLFLLGSFFCRVPIVIDGSFVRSFMPRLLLSFSLGVEFCCYIDDVFVYIPTSYEEVNVALAFLRITSFSHFNIYISLVFACFAVSAW